MGDNVPGQKVMKGRRLDELKPEGRRAIGLLHFPRMAAINDEEL